jgi:hypothetical protein
MGTDRSIIGGLYGPRSYALRLEIIGSFGIECSPLRDESGMVSYNLVALKDPCWSSFHLSDGGGGSRSTGNMPKILHERWSS